MKIRKIRKVEVTFGLHVEQDDMAVRGNALASRSVTDRGGGRTMDKAHELAIETIQISTTDTLLDAFLSESLSDVIGQSRHVLQKRIGRWTGAEEERAITLLREACAQGGDEAAMIERLLADELAR